MTDAPSIERLGDTAVLLRFGECIDAQTNRRVHAWAEALSRQAPAWLIELTPAYASLALHVDVARIHNANASDHDPLAAVVAWLDARFRQPLPDATCDPVRTLAIPVRYGDEDGPDLAAIAAHAGIATEDVIARHAAADYTVAMLGFAAGFPYLIGLDATLAMQRLSSPRTRVPAGSVGIGGAQTGIYPEAGPGGWRLIGRTPLRLFNAMHDAPSLFRAGDCVRFYAIDARTYATLDEHAR